MAFDLPHLDGLGVCSNSLLHALPCVIRSLQCHLSAGPRGFSKLGLSILWIEALASTCIAPCVDGHQWTMLQHGNIWHGSADSVRHNRVSTISWGQMGFLKQQTSPILVNSCRAALLMSMSCDMDMVCSLSCVQGHVHHTSSMPSRRAESGLPRQSYLGEARSGPGPHHLQDLKQPKLETAWHIKYLPFSLLIMSQDACFLIT